MSTYSNFLNTINNINILFTGRMNTDKSLMINALIEKDILVTNTLKGSEYPTIISHLSSNNKNIIDIENEKKIIKYHEVDLSNLHNKLECNNNNITLIDFPEFKKTSIDDYLYIDNLKKILMNYNTILFYGLELNEINYNIVDNDLKYLTDKCKNVFVILNCYNDKIPKNNIDNLYALIKKYNLNYNMSAVKKIYTKVVIEPIKTYINKIDYVRKNIVDNLSMNKVPVTILNEYDNDINKNNLTITSSTKLLISSLVGNISISVLILILLIDKFLNIPILKFLISFESNMIIGKFIIAVFFELFVFGIGIIISLLFSVFIGYIVTFNINTIFITILFNSIICLYTLANVHSYELIGTVTKIIMVGTIIIVTYIVSANTVMSCIDLYNILIVNDKNTYLVNNIIKNEIKDIIILSMEDKQIIDKYINWKKEKNTIKIDYPLKYYKKPYEDYIYIKIIDKDSKVKYFYINGLFKKSKLIDSDKIKMTEIFFYEDY